MLPPFTASLHKSLSHWIPESTAVCIVSATTAELYIWYRALDIFSTDAISRSPLIHYILFKTCKAALKSFTPVAWKGVTSVSQYNVHTEITHCILVTGNHFFLWSILMALETPNCEHLSKLLVWRVSGSTALHVSNGTVSTHLQCSACLYTFFALHSVHDCQGWSWCEEETCVWSRVHDECLRWSEH